MGCKHDDMSRDYQHRFKSDLDSRKVQFSTLRDLNTLLLANGKILDNFDELPDLSEYPADMQAELSINHLSKHEDAARDRTEKSVSECRDALMS